MPLTTTDHDCPQFTNHVPTFPSPDPLVSFQTLFQQRWGHLRHPDVRNLAWLLDSPILLNPAHPRWAGLLADLPTVDARCAHWLADLDQTPQPLLDHLALRPHTRLGHYAEHLLAWYFAFSGVLHAHSVQVRSHTTIGEFDFLLNLSGGLEHWEFACKFYLMVDPARSLSDLIGPNLADNLEDKSKKIMTSQLALGRHEQSRAYLPGPLHAAKALLKGWLFYPTADDPGLPELNPVHCRGRWCRISQLHTSGDQYRYGLLTRLRWLAPARVAEAVTLPLQQMTAQLLAQFAVDIRPVLIVRLVPFGTDWVEQERIFVVPDQWNLAAPDTVMP